jgi:hypothetical protein
VVVESWRDGSGTCRRQTIYRSHLRRDKDKFGLALWELDQFVATCDRRDRIVRFISVHGTKRTSRDVRSLVAIGGNADIPFQLNY